MSELGKIIWDSTPFGRIAALERTVLRLQDECAALREDVQILTELPCCCEMDTEADDQGEEETAYEIVRTYAPLIGAPGFVVTSTPIGRAELFGQLQSLNIAGTGPDGMFTRNDERGYFMGDFSTIQWGPVEEPEYLDEADRPIW